MKLLLKIFNYRKKFIYRCYSTMSDEPIVTVKQGKLRGAIRCNIDGGKYLSFRGIPFAEPPVGTLRFKDPQPRKPWYGIKDALLESNVSAQYDKSSDSLEGSDDCLYLDVATNSLSEKRPVMVWIHGGAFKQSSNTYKKYGPDYLLKHDIVFVSINYRLGVLGFLNMDHEDCPGNMGLKDQIAALKWVQENIHEFGGDPKNVTIFGESAGGVSVHALCLSPLATGLFHKAIIQSGVLTNPWANISSNKEYGYKLADALGKKCCNDKEVIDYLKTKPALEIAENFEKIFAKENEPLDLVFVPTVDNKSIEPILPIPIKELAKKGIDVPVIIGYNSHEGMLSFINTKLESINDSYDNEKLMNVIKNILKLNDLEKLTSITNHICNYYFNNDAITDKKINELTQFYGDISFVSNILNVIELQEKKPTIPTYYYKYSYVPDYPTIKNLMSFKIQGACHADEIGCLLYSETRRGKLKDGSRDKLCLEKMTKMWTNFAKFGNPTPENDSSIPVKWKAIESNKKNCLEISDNLTLNIEPDKNMWTVWKTLIDNL